MSDQHVCFVCDLCYSLFAQSYIGSRLTALGPILDGYPKSLGVPLPFGGPWILKLLDIDYKHMSCHKIGCTRGTVPHSTCKISTSLSESLNGFQLKIIHFFNPKLGVGRLLSRERDVFHTLHFVPSSLPVRFCTVHVR